MKATDKAQEIIDDSGTIEVALIVVKHILKATMRGTIENNKYVEWKDEYWSEVERIIKTYLR